MFLFCLLVGIAPYNVQLATEYTVMANVPTLFEGYWGGGTDMQFTIEVNDSSSVFEWDYEVSPKLTD